jgi:hypothetical protein
MNITNPSRLGFGKRRVETYLDEQNAIGDTAKVRGIQNVLRLQHWHRYTNPVLY